jgi:gas vesicle protein
MKDKNSDFGVFLAGLSIGSLVGAAVALLLAPQSGEETQRLIREKGIEIKDRAVEYGTDARLRAEKAVDEARLKADKSLDELRVRTDELAKMVKDRALEVQENLKSTGHKHPEDVVIVEDLPNEDVAEA